MIVAQTCAIYHYRSLITDWHSQPIRWFYFTVEVVQFFRAVGSNGALYTKSTFLLLQSLLGTKLSAVLYLSGIRSFGNWASDRWNLKILAARNRESGNLEIGVPVLGNRLFCAWLRIHFYRNISQGLAASAVRSSIYEYSCRNYHSVAQKWI